jgi:hypothetical protein
MHLQSREVLQLGRERNSISVLSLEYRDRFRMGQSLTKIGAAK